MRQITTFLCVFPILLCLLCRDTHAQIGQVIYDDSLANDWQDWSWSWSNRELNSTEYIHNGSRSIKVTYTAAWQGFRLRHRPFNSSSYTYITFWINGGEVSGRTITVAAQLNDVEQPSMRLDPYIAGGGGITAGTWRQVIIPLSALQADNKSNMTGFWLKEQKGSAQPPFYIDDISLVSDLPKGPPPILQVLSPQAGEIVQRSRPFTIRWQTTNRSNILRNHQVELSIDSGQTFNILQFAGNLPASAQQFEWNVPPQVIPSAQIRITAIDIAGYSGSSLSGFSIGDHPPDTQPPTVRFLTPLGGERFTSGDNIIIIWSSSDNVRVTTQDLALSTDSGASFTTTLASGLDGNIQSFTFKIPGNLQTSRARLRLQVRDAAGNRAEAFTSSDFQIQPMPDMQAPLITISRPQAGQIITAGQPITVNWRSSDNIAVVSQALMLSLDGGSSFQTISTFGADAGTFTLHNLDKTIAHAQVRITATDAAGNRGEQTTSFTLAPAITQANFSKPTLAIMGIGFTSANAQATVKVLINGREVVTSGVTIDNNTSITVRGNKQRLNLVRGNNDVQVIVDNVVSNRANFQF